MKKIIYLIAMIVLLAPPLWAQEKTPAGGQYQLGTPFDGDVRLGYRWNIVAHCIGAVFWEPLSG